MDAQDLRWWEGMSLQECMTKNITILKNRIFQCDVKQAFCCRNTSKSTMIILYPID